jgi:hypothetical protein
MAASTGEAKGAKQKKLFMKEMRHDGSGVPVTVASAPHQHRGKTGTNTLTHRIFSGKTCFPR